MVAQMERRGTLRKNGDKNAAVDTWGKQLVACITDKILEARLRWYGHVRRGEVKMIAVSKRSLQLNGRWSHGRQKKRWSDMVQQELVTLRLKPEDTADSDKWRRRTHVADPFPRDK